MLVTCWEVDHTWRICLLHDSREFLDDWMTPLGNKNMTFFVLQVSVSEWYTLLVMLYWRKWKKTNKHIVKKFLGFLITLCKECYLDCPLNSSGSVQMWYHTFLGIPLSHTFVLFSFYSSHFCQLFPDPTPQVWHHIWTLLYPYSSDISFFHIQWNWISCKSCRQH